MKNYELLGIHIDRPEEFPDRLRELDEVRLRVKSAPLWTYHRSYILTLLEYPCWEQMGYIDIPKLPQRLEDGYNAVSEYFHSDWWREENIRRVEREAPEQLHIKPWSTVEHIIEINAQRMDRSDPECMFTWYEPLRGGIVFGGLLEKWDDVAHICSALDPSVPPEYSAGTIVDEYFQYYLCVAGQFSGQWNDKFDALLQSAKKCRQKRLRDLIAAWEAAVAGDQAAFNKAFPSAIKSFVKRKDDPSEHMGVALDETVIWLVAKHAGLSFPDMPDKLKAAVMTRRSLGLGRAP